MDPAPSVVSPYPNLAAICCLPVTFFLTTSLVGKFPRTSLPGVVTDPAGAVVADGQYRSITIRQLSLLRLTTDEVLDSRSGKEHGEGQKGSENIWITVMGPDTKALGERINNFVTQAEIAATIAKGVPEAAPPITDVISQPSK
jgi:hypothetical protein